MLKLETLAEVLEQRLTDPGAVLDVLLGALAKGQHDSDLWERLHAAAVRDEVLPELAFAYEKALSGRRIKVISPVNQAEAFLHAAQFFSGMFNDADGAVNYAERALAAAPTHQGTFALMERLLRTKEEHGRLAKLYVDAASNEREPERHLALLREAAEVIEGVEGTDDVAIEVYQRILRVEPTDPVALEALQTRFLSSGRHREAVRLLEQAVSRAEPSEELRLRRRLVEVYTNELGEPQRAMPHVEGILREDPGDERALAVAEALLENRVMAPKAAAALADAYLKLNRTDHAAAMLTRELKIARGPRKTEVQKQLAILRQDALGDPAGALELLGPAVASDPGDDDLRGRFVQLSVAMNQPLEAAKRLARALQTAKEEDVRARVGAEIGEVYLQSGDVKRAQTEFEKVVDGGGDEGAVLAASRRLGELYAEAGEQKRLAGALELVVRLDPVLETRQQAARRLARVCDELEEHERAISAYEMLLDSPWEDEALVRLEALYEAAGNEEGLVLVLDRRAARSDDPVTARELAYRAADIRSSKMRDRASALVAWQTFIQTFGPSREAHVRLIPLLEQEKDWARVVEVLADELALAPADEKPGLLGRLGQVRMARLDDLPGALAVFREALAIDSQEPTSRLALEKLISGESALLEAAEVLEPVYREEQRIEDLVRTLEVRGAQAEDVEVKLSALEEAVALCEGQLGDAERALGLAGRGLAHAVSSARERAQGWLSRVNTLAQVAGASTLRAQVLGDALGNWAVDGPELLELARTAGEALAAADEVDRAVEIYRRALEYDPSSADLVQRVDELLTLSGSPEERLSLYANALQQPCEPARRKELLHAMARVQRRELKDHAAAVATWQVALQDDPRDQTAHQGLIEVYTEHEAWDSLYGELARVLEYSTADRRTATLERMAEVQLRQGDPDRALLHFRTLVAEGALDDMRLARVEDLAAERGDASTMRDVLTRRVELTEDEDRQADLLERLGLVHAQALNDPEAAASAWMRAAHLCETIASSDERAQRLYERVLEVAPHNRDAADRLVDIYAAAGSWQQVPGAFAVLVQAAADDREPVAKLMKLEQQAVEAGARDVIVALIDAALRRAGLSAERANQVLLLKARVLRDDGARGDEVARIYRDLLAVKGDHTATAAEAFAQFLQSVETTPERIEDRRWLYEWRVARAADPTQVLVAWARTEEVELQNPSRASVLYQRVLQLDPGRTDVLTELARLQAEAGNAEGALVTLRALRAESQGDDTTVVDARIAWLLLEHLHQPDEALEAAEGMLEQSPTDGEALQIVHRLLGVPELRARAAKVLERAAEGADDAQARGTVLETLLDMGEEGGEDTELAASRQLWFERLLECRYDDDAAAMQIALRGAMEYPQAETLWSEAERFARRLDDPGPVADAYAAALERELAPELAEEVGRRMVEFHEEWFEEPDRVIALLERVLALSPGAGWAFDRLKLAFNAAARWDELFRLYDRALRNAETDQARIELLREASMAAKDFAADSARAVTYLDQLHWLQPDDAGVEGTLERLHERLGQRRELIDLLTRRFRRVEGVELHDLRRRVAALWLDLGEPIPAFELLSAMRTDPLAGSETYDLLERLVEVEGAAEAIAPGVAPRQGRPACVRELSASFLREYYEASDRMLDVARMLEVGLEFARHQGEQVARLGEIVKLRLERLDDQAGAFQNVCLLVMLQPAVRGHRQLLHELAGRIGAHDRQANLLADVAREQSRLALRAELLREAADVRVGPLDDPAAAIELHLEVLELAKDDSDLALGAARSLDPLLDEAGRAEEHCMVLERRAELERDPSARRVALGTAARVASDTLGDLDRAVLNWRARLGDDSADLEALNGLCDCLARAERHEELIAALQARAEASKDAARVRQDLVRVARLYELAMSDRPSAIAAWGVVRARSGKNLETFESLVPLLEAELRWTDLAVLVEEEAAHEVDPTRRTALYRQLGSIHRSRTRQPSQAVEAFVSAKDWSEAINTAASSDLSKETALQVCRELLDFAVRDWTSDNTSSGSAEAAAWAIDDLGNRLRSAGRHEEVADLLLRGAELPFDRDRQRELRREAACVCSDQLQQNGRAIEIFRELFAEDPGDEAANASVTRLATLLEERGLYSEIAELWEKQAQARQASGNRAAAAALWARAAELWEKQVGDINRAILDFRAGAGLGGEVALEALARLHLQRGEYQRVAEALEWLCFQSSREALAERALRLAEAYVANDQRGFARDRLEQAALKAIDASAVRRRLAELYREDEAWAPLAALLTTEASRAPGAKGRLSLLREAAALHLEKRKQPNDAVPLLEQAVELEPDDPELRLELSRALELAERYEDAANILKAQIERYGSRRPKNRAVVHFQLARVSLKAGRRADAMSELKVANKIDPAHPGILQSLANLAFEEGQLDRAERTYRALLLVIRPSSSVEEPSRAEALLDLSEIAQKKGDSVRASEFVESAFEAALDTEREAECLEQALSNRGYKELLARAIQCRLDRARGPEDAARALADLVTLREDAPSSAEKDALHRRAQDIQARLEKLRTTDERAWTALSRVYDWLGDPSAEEKILEKRVSAWLDQDDSVLDADPFYRLARIRLGQAATRDEGVSLVERALSIRSDYQQAAELLRSAVEADPSHEASILLLEEVARQGDLKHELAHALALGLRLPTCDPTRAREAVALAREVGEDDLVSSILNSALALPMSDEDSAWVRLQLAALAAQEGDLSRALDLREAAAETLPGDERRALLLEVARASAEELKSSERAARVYETLLDNDPADRGAWEPLLAIYREDKQSEKLFELIDRTVPLVDSLEDRGALRIEQAGVLLEKDRDDEAATVLQEVLEDDPGHAKAALVLSSVLEKAGRHEDLVALLQSQLDMAKDRQDVESIVSLSMRIGGLLEQQQRYDDARDVYEAVLDWEQKCRVALEASVRVAERGDDAYALAEALERFLGVLEGRDAADVAGRLMGLRAEQKDADGVERALVAGFSGAPESAELREGLLTVYQRRDDWGEVADVLKRAIEATPADTALVPRLIEAYRAAGQVEDALAVLEGVLDADRPSPEMLIQRAELFMELGRYPEAVSSLDGARQAGGDCLDALIQALDRATEVASLEERRGMKLRLAELLQDRGDSEGARAKFGELIKDDPKDRDALRRLAELESKVEDWDNATKAYRQLIGLEEGDALVEVALQLSDACERARRMGDAQGGLERALRVDPHNPELRTRLALVYEANGDHRQLAAMFEEDAAQVDETADRLDLLLRAGALYLEPEGDLGEAIRVLTQARQLSSENLTGVVLLARALSANQQSAEAMNVLTETVAGLRGKRVKELADVYAEISRLHLEDGMLSDAMEALQRALEMDPRNGTLAMQLGQLALEIEEFETATRAFRTATMMKPYNEETGEGITPEAKADANYCLAWLAYNEGDTRKAKILASKTLAEVPHHEHAQALIAELDGH